MVRTGEQASMQLSVGGRVVDVVLTSSGQVAAVVSVFDGGNGEPLFQGSLSLAGYVRDVRPVAPQPVLSQADAGSLFDAVEPAVWQAALIEVLTRRQLMLRGAGAGEGETAAVRRSDCLLAALNYSDGPVRDLLLERAETWQGTPADLIATIEATAGQAGPGS